MSVLSKPSNPAQRFVSVVVERRNRRHKQWSYVDWSVTGVMPAPQATAEEYRTLIHSDPESERYLCGPLRLVLYEDGSEGYWGNLTSKQPSMFIVCHKDGEDEPLDPFLVTFNYDEISGYMEVDDPVFSFPIPEELYPWIEEFVVTHYRPSARKKRKRKDWKEDSAHGPSSARR